MKAEEWIRDNTPWIRSVIRNYWFKYQDNPTIDIDDLFQEVCIRLFLDWDRIYGVNENPYYAAIIRYAIIDYCQTSSWRKRSEIPEDRVTVALEDAEEVEADTQPDLLQVLKYDPLYEGINNRAKFFLWCLANGYTYQQIGDYLGLTKAQVQNRANHLFEVLDERQANP